MVSKLGGEIGQMRENFAQQLSGYVQRTSDAIERTQDKVRAETKPNMSALIGFATLLIVILGLGVTLLVSNLAGHANEIAALKLKHDEYQKNFADLEYKRGQSDAMQKFNGDQLLTADKKFSDLDFKLQNEAKLIQATADAKINAVENKFDARLKPIDDYLADFLKWRLNFVADTSDFRGHTSGLLDEVNQHANKIGERLWQDRYDKLKTYEGQDIQDLNGLRKAGTIKKQGEP